ncbi:hypothetical protein J6590_040061 [Homalodisca vitripennis]|nr:hypothetical protein J6590_040061 [Homalodisca vitripennis]
MDIEIVGDGSGAPRNHLWGVSGTPRNRGYGKFSISVWNPSDPGKFLKYWALKSFSYSSSELMKAIHQVVNLPKPATPCFNAQIARLPRAVLPRSDNKWQQTNTVQNCSEPGKSLNIVTNNHVRITEQVLSIPYRRCAPG